jgi:hypothetical protein
MTNAKPATRTVPLRAAPVLVSTNSSAVPPPVPLPRTTRTHEASLAAVHAHPATVDTPTVTVPPLAATAAEPGWSSNRHGAASCATTTRVSFMRIADDRRVATVFSATVTVTTPSPWPEFGES